MFWVKDRVTNVFSLISGENVFSAWHSNIIVSLLKNDTSQPKEMWVSPQLLDDEDDDNGDNDGDDNDDDDDEFLPSPLPSWPSGGCLRGNRGPSRSLDSA